jgi:fumarate reductase flavoprotein subunit
MKEIEVGNRRNFLKGSLLTGAGIAAGVASGSAGTVFAAEAPAKDACKKYSFEKPPTPIPASAIKTTKSADVVVLGAGVAGLSAAIAAAEKGAKVVLLEKRNTFTTHGGWNGAIGDRAHKAAGITIPKDKVMADLTRFGAYHPNASLIQLWINQSGRVMDNILDIADAAGVKYKVDIDIKEHWPYTEFPLGVNFLPAMQFTLGQTLEKKCKALGVEILYETPAAQLIRKDRRSRVTGVIAKGKEGYVRVDATKGVIVCTGGYGSNREMQEKYSPRVLKTINNQYAEGSNTGDGILMGMWVGGAKQETDCPMLWDGMIPGHSIFVDIARQPFLNVNLLGERYANEDAPFGYTANADNQQPQSLKWTVWDAKWDADKEKLHGTVCENMHIPVFWNSKSYDMWKSKGVIIEADTIEELGRKMGVPVDTFVASVQRYNELVEKGVDEDFGKDPEKLTSIVKGPFAAAKVGTGVLVTLDGLRINTKLQVLDTEEHPIDGLYAAGNASGDFFSNDYPITCQGVSHGRALTFGWLAGEWLATLKA